MAFVFAVNVGMICLGVAGPSPGRPTTDGFATATATTQVLAAAAQQAALGWSWPCGADERRHPVLGWPSRDGAPLAGAHDRGARPQRPLGPTHATRAGVPRGRARPLRGRGGAAVPGQWDLSIIARADGGSIPRHPPRGRTVSVTAAARSCHQGESPLRPTRPASIAACRRAGRRFCCPGCEAAYETIQGLGLGSYYAQRVLDPAARPPRPEPAGALGPRPHVATRPDGHARADAGGGRPAMRRLRLADRVGAGARAGVARGRVNMTTRRLRWPGAATRRRPSAGRAVERLGYRLVPFDRGALAAAAGPTGRRLMRALAVAGFAAGNVMFAVDRHLVRLEGMGPATRDLLHWVSALIAMPAIAYAGWPFFRSAVAALRQGRTNMDVPISIGVMLVTGMSLAETIAGGAHAYFDSRRRTAVLPADRPRAGSPRARPGAGHRRAVADAARHRCRGAAARWLDRPARPAGGGAGRCRTGRASASGSASMAWSERADLRWTRAWSPARACRCQPRPGTQVFAGTLNLGAPLTVRADGHRQRDAARRVRAADRRRRGAAEPIRRARRPGGPPLRAGGACLRAGNVPVLVFRLGRHRWRRRC